jgi:hypothetical protein
MIALTMRANTTNTLIKLEKVTVSPFTLSKNFNMVLVQTEDVAKLRQCLDTSYNVYIGNNTKRIFKHGTLPTFIKSKLAMIKAISQDTWNCITDDEILHELFCFDYKRFTKNNPAFKKIGWCVSDSIYVIILSEEELSELKGIRIDTREKSQSKSKTNS